MIITSETPGATNLLVIKDGHPLGRVVWFDTDRKLALRDLDDIGEPAKFHYDSLAWSNNGDPVGGLLPVDNDEILAGLLGLKTNMKTLDEVIAEDHDSGPLEAAFWLFDERRRKTADERGSFKSVVRELMANYRRDIRENGLVAHAEPEEA